MPVHFATMERVIEHYLDRRRSAPILSLREAVTALRAAVPYTPLDDPQLAALFAAAAVKRSRNVAFDMCEEPIRRRS
jgi:hypothetical protein